MTEPPRCPSCRAELPADAPAGLCPACLLQAGMKDHAGATTRFAPPAPAELQPHFPELEILALVGHGGMGAVYQARQKRLERIVALKILAPELGKDPAFAERFAREARALARLSHPHLVAVHDFGQSGPWFWILMEHVDGANLRQVLATGALSAPQALAIVPQLCEALQYAHDEGIVHRDIKPENILLDRRGQAKITDFGLAKLAPGDAPASQALTATGDLMGTAHYMAPEQIERAAAVDHRADLYSLGVVIYEMLTGGLPLGRFAPPSSKAAVDARLDEVVHKALEKDPERRYQRADQISTDVERIRTDPGAAIGRAAPPAGWTGPSPDADGTSLLLYGGLCLALAAGQVYHFRGDEVATLGLAQSAVVAVGGWHLMHQRDHRWVHAGRLAALVPIPLFLWAPGFGAIMVVVAWWYWWSRWRRKGDSWLRRVQRLRDQRAAPTKPSTGAPPAPPAPAADGLRAWHISDDGWAAVMVIACVAIPAVVAAPSTLPWIAVMVGAVALAVAFSRRGAAAARSDPSAINAFMTGSFRLLSACIIAAALVLVALIVVAALRPELLPREWRDRVHISIASGPQAETARPAQGGASQPRAKSDF